MSRDGLGRDKIVRDSGLGPWERATTRHSSTLMPMPEGDKKVDDVTRSFVKHSNVTLPGPWRGLAASGVPAAEYQEIIQIRHWRLKIYINRLSHAGTNDRKPCRYLPPNNTNATCVESLVSKYTATRSRCSGDVSRMIYHVVALMSPNTWNVIAI